MCEAGRQAEADKADKADKADADRAAAEAQRLSHWVGVLLRQLFDLT